MYEEKYIVISSYFFEPWTTYIYNAYNTCLQKEKISDWNYFPLGAVIKNWNSNVYERIMKKYSNN